METLATLLHSGVSFALIIGIIVLIHEGGHFLVARWCGVKVTVFSIGFGREIAGFTDRYGTRWKLSLLPLGGYVKMFGDAGAASTPDDALLKQMGAEDRRRSFHHQPLWRKSLIVAAGPVANFLLTIAVFTYLIFTVGVTSTKPVIGAVMADTPAASAGLQAGDVVLEMDHRKIRVFDDISNAMMLNTGTPVQLTIQRDGAVLEKTLTPIIHTDTDALNHPYQRPIIGIRSQQVTYAEVGALQAVWIATEKTYDLCVTSLRAMGQMITGERSARELKGTLSIAQMSGDVTRQGNSLSETLHVVVWFIALISANLGLVNLLPIPMLDGGHLAFYCLEALRGRPLAEKFQEYSLRFGMAILASLMAFTLFNDLRSMLAS